MVLRKHLISCALVLAITVSLTSVQDISTLKGCDYITKNQLEFEKLRESKRSNQANELQTQIRDENLRRYQQGQLDISSKNLDETKRSNLAKERFNLLSLDESQRHNLAYEAETQRSNQKREEQNAWSLEESKRANLAREAETQRANMAQEQLSRDRNIEQHRSNLAQESLGSERNFINLNSLYEQQRSNRANESLKDWYNQESMRLKERELQDRYFWTDKVNQALNYFLGSEVDSTIKKGNDLNVEIQQGINDALNRFETRFRTEAAKQASSVSESVIKAAFGLLSGVKDFNGRA